MKQFMKIAAGIVIGSLATSAITLALYGPIMKKLTIEMINDMVDEED